MAGRPKRNWDIEDFICRRCRLISSESPSSSFLSSGVSSQRGQASSAQVPYVPPSNNLRSYLNSGYPQDSSSNANYPCDHAGLRTTIPSPSTHSYTSQTRSTGVTFAHYQPQQGGFSTSRPTYSLQDVNPSQHTRYTITPQTVPATGITPYPSSTHVSIPSTFHGFTSLHSFAFSHRL